MNKLITTIKGSGSFIPEQAKPNKDFVNNHFYDAQKVRINAPGQDIIDKFEQITGICERRYITDDQCASGIAAIAAGQALRDAAIDPETIDQLIVAHNFGDVVRGSVQSNAVPSLAARVKHELGIRNPSCVAYDILFGCPGWLQGVIQADAFIHAGVAKRCLVVGVDVLSRVLDPHDRDSMIFSDGAGAIVLEGAGNAGDTGILSSAAQTFSINELNYINVGPSNDPEDTSGITYIKMQGRRVYEFALKHVPEAMKSCLDATGQDISQLKKIFIHQANEKLDEVIVKAFYKLYGITPCLETVMPMNIHELGNSSVATIPTLFDMVSKGQLPEHQLHPGDLIMFASVGAGMNINAVCYRM
ncbi:3-oxoacyl-ACP synthase III family protein [Chitinophaga flava]|uniref:3-oxoacyl-ACP synthase n=1 Tax=Chitinophaga flava TaxID=2259036 RepID=A0A365XZT6_9BACT|nr:3-oxoacyl-[acyl-carrier-protein] synthase III C-terminal domain-containing protein [Chitinophaga flava]RBL91075.1 3-oxoacyl-ACP synthase [Chitinophaga flava]